MDSLLLILAVFPGFFLIRKVYCMDKIESEPKGLIMRLVILGALSTVAAIVLETIGEEILLCFVEPETELYIFFDTFFVVAISEELCKYVITKKCTWKNKAFDYRFDAIVYTVSVSLGFAILENIMYSFDGGVSVAIMRAITAVPGHAVFGIFMGYFYGAAKLQESLGNRGLMKKNLRKAIWVPVMLHGFYDYCALSQNSLLTIVFFIFVIVLYRYAFKKLKDFAEGDMAINPNGMEPFTVIANRFDNQEIV